MKTPSAIGNSLVATAPIVLAMLISGLTGTASLLAAEDSAGLFPDKALEKAVRWEVFDKRYNEEPLNVDDVKKISQVVARGKGIKNLEGLQHCESLMKIDLAENEVEDLQPISKLKLLQSIDFSANQISDLAALQELTQLQYLQISKNKVVDLQPVKGLTNLNSLYLNENAIESTAPLSELKKLWTLQLAKNPLKDLNGIAGLKGLKTLNLQKTGVKNVEFLAEVKELNLVLLQENELESIDTLVAVCESDADRRIAPFLQLYLEPKTVTELQPAIEKLRELGVRINPERR